MDVTEDNGVAQFVGHSVWPDNIFLVGRNGETIQINCRVKAEFEGEEEGRRKEGGKKLFFFPLNLYTVVET